MTSFPYYQSFNDAYREILIDVYEKGIYSSPRGEKVKEIFNYGFSINPANNIVSIPDFETNLKYARKELDWYLSGTNRIDFDPLIEKIWKKYSNDGETVQSAYGHEMFRHQPTPGVGSQWEWVKNELKKDRDSRRAVINLNLSWHKSELCSKDFPCTMYLAFAIREGCLKLSVSMRSSDVYFGLRNDVYCFTELQKKMAAELGVSVGTYYHHSVSIHLYEEQWEKVIDLIKKNGGDSGVLSK